MHLTHQTLDLFLCMIKVIHKLKDVKNGFAHYIATNSNPRPKPYSCAHLSQYPNPDQFTNHYFNPNTDLLLKIILSQYSAVTKKCDNNNMNKLISIIQESTFGGESYIQYNILSLHKTV